MVNQVIQCIKCEGHMEIQKAQGHCKKCGDTIKIIDKKFFFTIPPPDVEVNTKPPVYELWSNWRKENYHFLKKHLSEIKKSKKVVDLGAGPTQFRDIFLQFDQYIGVDYYPYEHVSIVTDFTQKLPIKSGSVDVVILSNVLEHVPNHQFFLQECARILTKNGKILITIPFLMRIHQKPYDYIRLTHYALRKLLAENEFVGIEVKSLGSPVNVYHSMQNHFFLYLVGTQSNLLAQLLARIVRKIHALIFLCLRSFYRRVPTNLDYTEGYGAVALRK